MPHPIEIPLPIISDVIVIGSGFAGLTAAIEARMSGGQIIVLEKMKAIGGNSIISDGGIAAPDTAEQHLLGIQDNAQMMFEDMMASGEGLNDPALTKTVCDHALEAYLWSKEVLKVRYAHRVDVFGGHRVPRCYSPDPLSGSTMILKMRDKCDELGIPIFTGVSVESLLKNENGHIIGLKADPQFTFAKDHVSKTVTILASKGIIVATGGYAADLPFLNQLDPSFNLQSKTTNKRSATAEVLKACMAVGANTIHLDQIQWMPWTTPDEPGYGKGGLFGDYIVSSFGILIDTQSGQRFVNEQSNRKTVTQKILNAGSVIGLADAKAVEKSGWDLSIPLRKGIIRTHDTLLDLARFYDIPLESLQKTIETYDRNVKDGIDPEFGKTIEPWMSPLDTLPFYSMRITPKTHYTLGGLTTDSQTHVLDQQGQIIKGLFAAGEVTGTTHGANRLGSCSVTECLVMGRIAGRSVLGL